MEQIKFCLFNCFILKQLKLNLDPFIMRCIRCKLRNSYSINKNTSIQFVKAFISVDIQQKNKKTFELQLHCLAGWVSLFMEKHHFFLKICMYVLYVVAAVGFKSVIVCVFLSCDIYIFISKSYFFVHSILLLLLFLSLYNTVDELVVFFYILK